MSTLLRCPYGHQWDLSLSRASRLLGLPVSCPTCGTPVPIPPQHAEARPNETRVLDETRLPVAAPTAILRLDARPPRPQGGAPMVSEDEPPTLNLPDLPPAPTSQELPRVDRYQLLGVLGSGGMGVVYKARQAGLNRLVALKMLLTGSQARPEELARFRSEVEAVARLQHPHIVQIYEVGVQDGKPYFSLEYMEGGSLHRKLAGNPQAPRQAARLVATLAGAMQFAHERGVVHRDLKPANILLTADGEPKVTDFGIAKFLEGDSHQTQTGLVLGTPSYMAPEQAAGRSREVGTAADTYSLGAILYELLTGRPPFRAESPMDTVQHVLYTDPVAPRQLQPKVPQDLETICLKCLQKEPRRRYPSAGALADDLYRFLHGEPIVARPTGAWERAEKWARRRPAVAALSGLLGLFTFVGFAAILLLWRHADAQRLHAEAAHRGTASALAQAEKNLYFHRIALAEREWQFNNVGRADELLDDCAPPLRAWEWHYLKHLCHTERLALAAHPQGVQCLAYSPDGRRLAAGGLGGLKVWDAATGEDLHAFDDATASLISDLAFSPDGRRIATVGADGVARVWEPGSRAEVLRLEPPGRKKFPFYSVAFSPDGRRLAAAGRETSKTEDVLVWDLQGRGTPLHLAREAAPWPRSRVQLLSNVTAAFHPVDNLLAVTSRDGSARLWDLGTGREVRAFAGHAGILTSLAFSPDGQRLATASEDRTARLWEVATGKELLALRGHQELIQHVAFHPRGHQVATAGNDQLVKLWDVATGEELQTLRGHKGLVYAVAFSPDGSALATGGNDRVVKVWDAATGQGSRAFAGHKGNVRGVAVSPDGARVASASEDRTVRVWHAATGQLQFTLAPDDSGFLAVAFSPDGRHLAAGSRSRLVRIWDAQTGQEVAALPGHAQHVTGVAFSLDGRLVASASRDATVKLWDVANHQEVRTFKGHTHGVVSVTFSPDGSQLLTASYDQTIRLWDVATGAEVKKLFGHTSFPTGAVFSPDGRRVASSAQDHTARVWDAATGRELLTLVGHKKSVYAVTFSPDGCRLATAGLDGDLKLWDAVDGQEILTLRGHQSVVTSVAFSPDGQRLYSGSWDRTVRLWEAPATRPEPRGE